MPRYDIMIRYKKLLAWERGWVFFSGMGIPTLYHKDLNKGKETKRWKRRVCSEALTPR